MRGVKSMLILCTVLMGLIYSGCGTDTKDTIYICQIGTEYWVLDSGTMQANLAGSYTLTDISIDFYTVFGNHIKNVTKDNFLLAEGYQSVDPLSLEQDFSFAGTVHLTNNWYLEMTGDNYLYSIDSIDWADSSSGTAYLDGYYYEVAFSVSGDILALTWPVSCFLLEESEPPPEEESAMHEREESTVIPDPEAAAIRSKRMFFPVQR